MGDSMTPYILNFYIAQDNQLVYLGPYSNR